MDILARDQSDSMAELSELVGNLRDMMASSELSEIEGDEQGLYVYKYLVYGIQACAEEALAPIAAALPDWLSCRKIKKEYAEKIWAEWDRVWTGGDYSKRIKDALLSRFSVMESVGLAQEAGKAFHKEIIDIFNSSCCLYVTDESLDLENPVPPRIYNDMIGEFWDDEAREWIKEDGQQDGVGLIFAEKAVKDK